MKRRVTHLAVLVVTALAVCAPTSGKQLEFGMFEILDPAPPPDVRTFVMYCQPVDGEQWNLGDHIEIDLDLDLTGIMGASFEMRSGPPMDTIDVMLPPDFDLPEDWPVDFSFLSDSHSPPNRRPLPGHDMDIHVEKANNKQIKTRHTDTRDEDSDDPNSDPITPVNYRHACGAVYKSAAWCHYMATQQFSMRVTNKTSEDDPGRHANIGTGGTRGSYYEHTFYLDRYDGSIYFTTIPEPAMMGLLTLGGLALLRRRRG